MDLIWSVELKRACDFTLYMNMNLIFWHIYLQNTSLIIKDQLLAQICRCRAARVEFR